MSSETFAVELRRVTKRFGQFTAVDDISLEIQDGEFFSLLGPSGCGKTTTLRMIAGFEHPTDGSVLIHGEAQGYRPPFKRPVNTVFQNYALFPHMSVAQNVSFGLEMQKVPAPEIAQRVAEALSMVQLQGLEKRQPKQLSGGQQQRVALARAIINRPKVLLLDEPLGALDLKLRKAMQLELKALQAQLGITFIYVTHDQEEALTMSDRIAVMYDGRVRQVGAPRDIYERPASRFVADFIGETNFLDGVVTAVDAETATVLVDDQLPLQAGYDRALQEGDRVVVALRPEKLGLTAAIPAGHASAAGEVTEVTYIGTDTRYSVRLTANSSVIVREQNLGQRDHQAPQPGASVQVTWVPGNARVLVE